jgi:NADPH-dependent 2,4-dienoyl-CoA reductase/sulfur reductase-like enzyme/nitrite reductase/ring-hydroxylating ferredoxin subunit
MSETGATPPGPDLSLGVAAPDLVEGGMVLGHVGDQPVLLARTKAGLWAVDAECTHYHGPLAEGLLVGETVRCPWHHARFCLNTGEAIGAPAIDPLGCWRVEERDGLIFVSDRAEPVASPRREVGADRAAPRRVVIIGGGAAGFAAAEMLRREGHGGDLIVLSDDPDPPYDRPNCSKDYLAGKAPRDWMPLKDSAFYENNRIDLRTGAKVSTIDARARSVTLGDGQTLPFDALVLATGAAAVHPPIPGFGSPRVYTLRTMRDCEAIIAAAGKARRVAVVGASFIGLEVAAALVERGLKVSVVAPEAIPLARIIGDALGRFVRSVHEAKGVVFHLERSAAGFETGKLTLDDGTSVAADFVVVGVGVKPRVDLAAAAGLAIDRGIVVDARFRTSAPGVFAVGDVARYPDARTGESIRVEHWAAAQRQGQHLARVLLDRAGDFAEAPFFWSAHYDTTINYVGHAETFDAVDVDGDIAGGDATVRLKSNGRVLAAATLGRDLESLGIELDFES